MFTTRKMIGSSSLWLLAACILPLCLATPAAALSTDLTARANHRLLPSQGLAEDTDILIPKPPPPPPSARMAILAPCAAVSSTDLAAQANHRRLPSQGLAEDTDILIPKPPPPPPTARA